MEKELLQYLFENEEVYKISSEYLTATASPILEESKKQDEIIKPSEKEVVPAVVVLEGETVEAVSKLKYLKLLVLCNANTTENIEFISKIAGAVKLAVSDFTIEFVEGEHLDLQRINSKYAFTNLLSFGLLSETLPLTEHRIFTKNRVNYLLTKNIEIAKTDRSVKQALWASLQQMFVV